MLITQKIPSQVQLNFQERTNELKRRFESIPDFLYSQEELKTSLKKFSEYCSLAYNDTKLSKKLEFLMNYLDSFIRSGLTGQNLFEIIKSGFNSNDLTIRFTTHEQVGLLEYLHSERVAYLISHEHKLEHIIKESIKDPHGTRWQKASINLAGQHCRGHNYDAMQASYPKNSQVLALVCDGVSGEGRPKGEKNLLLGRAIAKFTVTKFQELISKYDLAKISTGKDREAFINNIMQELQKEITRGFLLNTLIPELTINLDEPFTCVPAATFTAALDFGDEIGLISVGDSHIFALDDKGIIINSINDHHISTTESDPQYRMHSALGLYCRDSIIETGTLVGISKKIHKKKDIKAIIASSDALFEDKLLKSEPKLNPSKVNSMKLLELDSSEAILTKLIKSSKSEDDRTVQVLMREPSLTERLLKSAEAGIRRKLNI